jgi:hypothetical protein
MSATAPATVDSRATGSIKAVCTSATLSGDDVICVIDQAAPTPMISSPKFESRLAVQMRRNTPWRSGAKMPLAVALPPLAVSLIVELTSWRPFWGATLMIHDRALLSSSFPRCPRKAET